MQELIQMLQSQEVLAEEVMILQLVGMELLEIRQQQFRLKAAPVEIEHLEMLDVEEEVVLARQVLMEVLVLAEMEVMERLRQSLELQ